jgi:hypothetical protein
MQDILKNDIAIFSPAVHNLKVERTSCAVKFDTFLKFIHEIKHPYSSVLS